MTKVKRWIVCGDGYVRLRDVNAWRVDWEERHNRHEEYFETKLAAQQQAVREVERILAYQEQLLRDRLELVAKTVRNIEIDQEELRRRKARLTRP